MSLSLIKLTNYCTSFPPLNCKFLLVTTSNIDFGFNSIDPGIRLVKPDPMSSPWGVVDLRLKLDPWVCGDVPKWSIQIFSLVSIGDHNEQVSDKVIDVKNFVAS